MKFKKLISSVLLLAVVLTSLVVAFPISVSAAYEAPSGTVATAELSGEKLKSYLSKYLSYDYATAEEMLKDELEAGYLYSVNSKNNLYSLYVNKYTGFVFYQNNITGQILTSNPIDPGYTKEDGSKISDTSLLMSQLEISFAGKELGTASGKYNSYTWAASRAQISVSPISNGLRVNYILGDTTPKFLLPGAITAKNFDEKLLTPMIRAFQTALEEMLEAREYVTEESTDFFEGEDYIPYDDEGYINTIYDGGLTDYLSAMRKIAEKACGDKYYNQSDYKALDSIRGTLSQFVNSGYSMENPIYYNPESEEYAKMAEKYPIFGEGVAIYVCAVDTDMGGVANRRKYDKFIKTYCPEYTFDMMYQDEQECGFVYEVIEKPAFRCALEYSFNSDGSLSARLPSTSITYDETKYDLEYVRPLQYFGCADASNSGYIFFPDGSGTVIDFKDFYVAGTKPNINLYTSIYGLDYAYSSMEETYAYRQQVTMPVYGIVNEVAANASTKFAYGKESVTNGYFAIIEEGSSLATLSVSSDFGSNKYGTAYVSYTPYAKDTFDLSEISVSGGTGLYSIYSPFKYNGSYTTRYVMLSDAEIGSAVYGEDAYYESSYSGMAAYYKNYLKSNGTLAALEMVSENLPLYIEVLGAMDINTKFLSFPVTETVPLTSFEDVLTMQSELSSARDTAIKKAEEQEALAAQTADEILKAEYTALAAEYRAFAETVQNITNINFRLTGFANGGVKATYPTASRWERACGGAGGFENLVAAANAVSANSGVNFGVYPEFDFMYINNTATFDGISNNGNVSKMIDNRYASMQIYNTSMQEFESLFDLAINSGALGKLYTKFEKSFRDSGSKKISASTLGSALNSNFDEDEFISREDSMKNIDELLSRMTKDGYELMLDIGNVYSLKYATHLLNVATDSSHFRYASYAVPFTGLVLHSYVNYAGTPLNYSGNLQYEILKSIESGAAPYYILCYQNSAHLKEDEELNDYYGVSYQNWFNDIVTTYAEINSAIGSLQDYEISNHKVLTCERVIEKGEWDVNYVLLENEIINLLSEQLEVLVDEAYAELKAGGEANYPKRLKLEINGAALLAQFAGILNIEESELKDSEFMKNVNSIIASYTSEYSGAEDPANSYVVSFDAIEYTSQYSFLTDSSAFDKEYVTTDYTIDNGSVCMVTYRKGDDVVRFLINYNNFSVTVRLDADTLITLDKLSFKNLDKEG